MKNQTSNQFPASYETWCQLPCPDTFCFKESQNSLITVLLTSGQINIVHAVCLFIYHNYMEPLLNY